MLQTKALEILGRLEKPQELKCLDWDASSKATQAIQARSNYRHKEASALFEDCELDADAGEPFAITGLCSEVIELVKCNCSDIDGLQKIRL